MNVVEIENLCKSYDGFSIENLSMTVPNGCIIGIVGENGAGKTTLLKLILDIIKKDSGSIRIFGDENIRNITAVKEDIGIVPDEIGISEWLTVSEIGKIMEYTFKNWDSRMYSELIKKFGLPEKKNFKDFSKGMKMKTGIAIALSHNPRLLILDEATSGLDPVVRDEIIDIFGEFTRDENHSVIMSSHIVSDLEKICDYIAFMHKGKLMMYEEKDLIREKYRLIHCNDEVFNKIDKTAVIGKKSSPYGTEAIVKKESVPYGIETSSVDIEQLFIFMVRGGN